MIKCLLPLCLFLLSAVPTCLAQPEIQQAWTEQWKNIRNGETITLPEGKFHFTEPLGISGVADVKIKGAGLGKTILSFSGGETGGIHVTDAQDVRFEEFTVEDAPGDAFLAKDVWNIQFTFVEARGNTTSEFGIHAVECQRVLVYECRVSGNRDAGICGRECEQMVIRKCTTTDNGTGIAIENTSYADLVDNVISDNSCGVRVADLPHLEKKLGGPVKMYQNTLTANNRPNSMESATFPSLIPPGTGMLVLAGKDLQVYNNTFMNQSGPAVAIFSYASTGLEQNDVKYSPFSARIEIHHNRFSREKKLPRAGKMFGMVSLKNLGKEPPHILLDGVHDELCCSPTTGRLLPEFEICLQANTGETFGKLDPDKGYKLTTTDASLFRCE